MYIVSNDNGWLEFQDLKKGETTVQNAHLLQAYDVDADGNLSNRRVVVDYSKLDKPCSGPDGILADSEGNIWLASRCEYRPGIQVLNPQGKELAYISTGNGTADQHRLRPRRGFQPVVPDLGQEPVQDPGRQERLSACRKEFRAVASWPQGTQASAAFFQLDGEHFHMSSVQPVSPSAGRTKS